MSLNFLLYFERTEWRVIETMECKIIPFWTAEERDRTDTDKAEALLSQAMEGFHKKLVVLDDDPTGVQTVHDVLSLIHIFYGKLEQLHVASDRTAE